MGDSAADYSVFVSNVLDTMGYSSGMIRQRKQMAMIAEEDSEEDDDDYKYLISGSKGEGLTTFFESDCDVLFEERDILCTKDMSKYANCSDTTILQTIDDIAAPGYTFLKPTHNTQDERFVECSPASDNFCLPNSVVKMRMQYNVSNSDFDYYLPTEGPSIPGMYELTSFDLVLAYKCEFPNIIDRFLARDRKFDQPSMKTLEEVANLDCHVVPVGSKCGDRPDLEWRISFTMAEIHSLGCLNETQVKVYVLLKLLAKSNFHGLKSVSSYTLKNIVLWMSELFHKDTFRPELLVPRLLDALKLLRHCVRHRYLPNYMIHERNLFSGRLNRRSEQLRLLHMLSVMIDKGGNVLLMCPRLKEAMVMMYDSPAKARRLGNIRDTVEQWSNEWGVIDDLDDEIGSWIKHVCWKDFEEYCRNKDGAQLRKAILSKLKQGLMSSAHLQDDYVVSDH